MRVKGLELRIQSVGFWMTGLCFSALFLHVFRIAVDIATKRFRGVLVVVAGRITGMYSVWAELSNSCSCYSIYFPARWHDRRSAAA